MTKRNRTFFAAILFSGLILRCIAIGSRSIQYDDAFTFFLAGRSLVEIVQGTLADTMPPLFYFILHFWLWAGSSLIWIRLLSVLFSLAAVILLFFVVRDLADEEAALWAMGFAAISPFQIYHAQDIRMYALLAAAQMAVYLFFVRIWLRRNSPGNSWWNWAGLVVSAVMVLYTHNLGIFGLAAPFFFLILKKEYRLLFRYTGGMAAAGVLALPWWLVLPEQLQKIQTAFWTPRPGIIELTQAIIQTIATLPLPMRWLYFAAFISLTLVVLVIIESWRRRKESGVQFLALSVLSSPVIIIALSYLMRPIFVPRGFIIANLAFYGLAGILTAHKFPKGVGILLSLFFIAASAISLPYQISFCQFPRSPFREAMLQLASTVKTDEVILHDNKLSYLPAHFYEPGLQQKFLPDEPGSHNDTFARASQEAMQIFPESNWRSAVNGKVGVYFVVFTQTINEYKSMGLPHPVVDEINREWHLEQHTVLNDLEIYHFLP